MLLAAGEVLLGPVLPVVAELRRRVQREVRVGEMARRHEGWIVEMFAGLAESERNALYTMLAKLKRHLNAVESESAR